MSKLRLATTLAAALVLAAASAAPAQNRRGDRRERYNRDGGRSERQFASTQASSQPSGSGATTRPGGRMDEQFAVLLQRSIFARSGIARGEGRPPDTTSRPSTPQFTPEQAVVFVGVLAQDDEFVAFAENQVTHQLMVLRAGDDVANGKVIAINLDRLAYGTPGAFKEVHLGQNLAGEVVSSSVLGGATGGGSSTASSAPSTAGMTPEQAAVIERMRKRRESGQ